MKRLSGLSTMVADRRMNHSVCLEVRGKNQLMKELNECALASIVGGPDLAGKKKNRTYMEQQAIHRNEVTDEYEP